MSKEEKRIEKNKQRHEERGDMYSTSIIHVHNISEESEQKAKRKIIIELMIWIVAAITYVIIGATMSLWHPGWLIFIAAQAVDALFVMIYDKKPSHSFLISICVVVYLWIGFGANIWHPTWLIFFLVPLYEVILKVIKVYRH